MQYSLYAIHTNIQGRLNLTVCHISILHYQFTHNIDVFGTVADFERPSRDSSVATNSGLGWCFFAKSASKLIDFIQFFRWVTISKAQLMWIAPARRNAPSRKVLHCQSLMVRFYLVTSVLPSCKIFYSVNHLHRGDNEKEGSKK